MGRERSQVCGGGSGEIRGPADLTRRGFLALPAGASAQRRAAAPSSGFVQGPGAEIYYELTGSGPAIVFAHGLGGNHLSWWQQIPHFAPTHTCVTLAHRGFAPSRLDSGSPDPADFAGDLARLLDHLKLEKVSLVAQSMGGWTCLDFALKQAERVRALVMASTSGTMDLNTLPKPDREKIDAWYTAHAGAEAGVVRRGIHPAAGERMAAEQPSLHFLYREIDQINRTLDKATIRARLRDTRSVPVSRVAALQVPMLFLCGEEDIVFLPVAAAALAAAIPGAKLERGPAAGHSVYFERPAAFNRIVERFV